MKKVAEAPIHFDLSELSQWLKLKGVPHRITEQDQLQIIWMPTQRYQDEINQVLERYLGDAEFRASINEQIAHGVEAAPVTHTLYPRALPAQAPVIYVFILISVAIAYLTDMGQGGPILRALLIINPFEIDFPLETLDQRMAGLIEMLSEGQFWRLLSPDFLHFSMLHIVFNMLMLWTLGGQLEMRKGSLAFLSMALFVSVVSNIAQLLDSGYLFGGMSGVVYGLVGYCWVWRRVNPDIFLPDALFRFSIIWLLLGYTPLTEWLGIGKMANSAHLYGLLSGLLWGWLTTNLGAKKIPSAE